MSISSRIARLSFALCLLPSLAAGQDLEPRRWTPLPPGMNVAGVVYTYTDGDVLFDPVLKLEDTDVKGDLALLTYVRAFEAFGKRMRFDALVPRGDLRWSGLLDGEPASLQRIGLADPYLRLSVILSEKRQPESDKSTVIGAAVGVFVPWGEHFEDKLLNLGQNRFVVRPHAGVLHTRGNWSYEFTGSVFLYEDNDEFFDGLGLEQDPLFAVQTHLIRSFDTPGYWASLSAGYGWDGESTVDGVDKGDKKRVFLSALSFGAPIGRNQSLKVAYVRNRTNTDLGTDTDSVAVSWSIRF